ncbi:MAG TPA: peptidoglycan-binding domain-containing protein [Candidatus Acidoferrum sp.]|nr:peptidoglycan-binding domain-containing protein [Candidatus Acidoferrum sp.]
MRIRNANHLALTLLVAAGLGVCVASAEAQSTAPKKPTVSKTGSSTHRSKSSKKSSRRERGQKVPTADRISEIQQALAKDGSFAGKPNGKWDDSTIEATRKFQEAHGLNPTGKLDAKTLQQLGLGSQTTGIAPPMPPVSSSALQKTVPPQPSQRQP